MNEWLLFLGFTNDDDDDAFTLTLKLNPHHELSILLNVCCCC